MSDIYDYEERIQRFRRKIKDLRNGELALHFLDHLEALELATATVSKYAGHLPALLRAVDFDLQEATRRDVERVVAWINRQPYKERTKRGKKLALRKLVQYAKFGSCSRETPIPPEVGWYSLTVKEKDSRVTPESLITPLEFGKMVKAAENSRDRALVYVPFEAALRPGERVKSFHFPIRMPLGRECRGFAGAQKGERAGSPFFTPFCFGASPPPLQEILLPIGQTP